MPAYARVCDFLRCLKPIGLDYVTYLELHWIHFVTFDAWQLTEYSVKFISLDREERDEDKKNKSRFDMRQKITAYMSPDIIIPSD